MGNAILKKKNSLLSKAASFPIKFTSNTNSRMHKQTSAAMKYHTRIKEMQEEINLLTSYGSDTIYRLRFDTMRYDYISPSVEKLLGFSQNEIKKINFRSLLAETRLITDGVKKVESFNDLEKARKQGDVGKWQADYLIHTKSGKKIWVSDISHPWLDKNGKVIGSIGSLRDINERVIAEEKVKDHLQKSAMMDAATGLPGRTAFFQRLEYELRRINRTEHPLSVALFEIDKFNEIKDTYGKEIATLTLVEVGKIIANALRETDFIAKLEGPEFAVILPECTTQGGYWVADRIRNAVQNTKFMLGNDENKFLKCCVSAGVTDAFPDQEKKTSDMYKEAGTRLYIAQNTGHNQVSVDEIMQTH